MLPILRVHQLATFCLAVAGLAMLSRGDEKLNYVAAPLKTELHRSKISAKASAFAIVNASAFEASGVEDLKGLPRERFEADLRSMSAKDDRLLRILISHGGNKRLSKDAVVQLKEQLGKSAKSCGYREVEFTEQWTSTEWESGNGALGTGLLDDSGQENLIMNPMLIAAPLRTRISKLHIGSGDAFIELRQPFDARRQQLTDDTQTAIRRAVESMKLDTTRELLFHVSSTKAGKQAIESLFSNRQPPAIPQDAPQVIKDVLLEERKSFQISPALKLAQELGFKSISYRHSGNGGAPELLLETKAPDFELKDLAGQSVKFSEWRKDRPALISFWGVACGPCRLEAPHLSRLHEKYGADVAILGINAYRETEETIQAYVTKEKLKHPIVIGGGTLAETIYQVGAYPTTFWINHRGEVVRYVVGFENGAELEAELVDFMADDKR